MSDTVIDQAVFNGLKEAVGADYVEELIHTFLAEAPSLIAQLRPSLNAGDTEAFRRAAHSVKSNAATFGATHLLELAKELEFMARENRLGEIGSRLEGLEEAFAGAAEALKGLCA